MDDGDMLKTGRLVCRTPAAAGGSVAVLLVRICEDPLTRRAPSTFTAAVTTTLVFPPRSGWLSAATAPR